MKPGGTHPLTETEDTLRTIDKHGKGDESLRDLVIAFASRLSQIEDRVAFLERNGG